MPSPRRNSVDTKQHLRMEIKDISSTGEFDGLLSVYNNVDQGRDMVKPGAFTKTIQEHGTEVPLLWQHKPDVPIGMLTLQDGPEALHVKGRLLMDLPAAKEAYLLIKARIVKGLSIGFETLKDEVVNGVRQLKELRLFEGSIVTFPMNEMATILTVKAAAGEPNDFTDELLEVQLRAAGYQMMCALDNALCDVRCSDLSKDEQVSASRTIISQFTEAYLAYLPAYADMMDSLYSGMEVMDKREAELQFKAAAKRTKRVDGVDLTADCFAYVGDPERTETWKLPIKFPGDEEKTKSHIRNALARFSQTQGIPESEKPKVLAKIDAAAKKYGIDVSDKAIEAYVLEEKAGRTHSAATMETYGNMRIHVKALDDYLIALQDEAGDATSNPAAAESKTSEPDEVHSAAQILEAMRSLYRAA